MQGTWQGRRLGKHLAAAAPVPPASCQATQTAVTEPKGEVDKREEVGKNWGRSPPRRLGAAAQGKGDGGCALPELRREKNPLARFLPGEKNTQPSSPERLSAIVSVPGWGESRATR